MIEVTEEYLKESFSSIRIQAIEQCIELVKQKIGFTSDPRSMTNLIDDLRKMLEYTKGGKL